jgi:hypothetical protein
MEARIDFGPGYRVYFGRDGEVLGELARRTRLNRVSLYRTLSARGNPELRSLGAVPESLGLRLAVEVHRRRIRRTASPRRTAAGAPARRPLARTCAR